MTIKEKKVYHAIKETRRPILIEIKKKDGTVVKIRGMKITKKPQKVVFRKIEKMYYKPNVSHGKEKKDD